MDSIRIQEISTALLKYSAVDFNKDFLKTYPIQDLIKTLQYSKVDRVVFRAAWALEHLLLQEKQVKTEHQESILNFFTSTTNKSALRSTSKLIINWLNNDNTSLFKNEEIESSVLNKSFELLENPETPIAVRANMYDLIFKLGKKEEALLNELKNYILFDLEKQNSPALNSRGKKILKTLKTKYHLY